MKSVSFHEGGLFPVVLIVIFSAVLVFVSPVAAVIGMAFLVLGLVIYGATRDESEKVR